MFDTLVINLTLLKCSGFDEMKVICCCSHLYMELSMLDWISQGSYLSVKQHFNGKLIFFFFFCLNNVFVLCTAGVN